MGTNTRVPDTFLGEAGPSCAGSHPSLQGVGRDGQAPRKGKRTENVYCLWFHLGASNLLAQLMGTVNLLPQLTARTGLEVVIKVFPAPSPLLVAETGPGTPRQAESQDGCSYSSVIILVCPPSLPPQLVKLVPDGTFPVARGADHAWIPNCWQGLEPARGWDTCVPPALPSPQSC